MEFVIGDKDRKSGIAELFAATFTQSEGAEEGALIGSLAADLLEDVPPKDIFVFSALEGDAIAGSIIFTRMSYPEDDRTIFLLSPVAVSPSHQNQGLGQKLLHYGLEQLRQHGVDVALTYGDINFYAKVGFVQITETQARPPLSLTYPEGWLGQSLTTKAFTPLKGPSKCVGPLDNPALW